MPADAGLLEGANVPTEEDIGVNEEIEGETDAI